MITTKPKCAPPMQQSAGPARNNSGSMLIGAKLTQKLLFLRVALVASCESLPGDAMEQTSSPHRKQLGVGDPPAVVGGWSRGEGILLNEMIVETTLSDQQKNAAGRSALIRSRAIHAVSCSLVQMADDLYSRGIVKRVQAQTQGYQSPEHLKEQQIQNERSSSYTLIASDFIQGNGNYLFIVSQS
ncbi:MAG: hypothetical protein EZS28_041452 [Streblomastix strix]|uniref:Uncharacterized protein n=1 Tax=Streblomastix strix TaxID=222440 RepID=A0A5J4TZE2_9EUKA|nr:MAG: hypothetical protein EZS28_041452 [Streblomastix strix]